MTVANRRRRLADSVAAFLTNLAKGDTGVLALDTSNIGGRAELVTWLRLNRRNLTRASR